MKSIGIITIHCSQNNYGGALQSFGLYEYLRGIGSDVEVIDLRRPNQKGFVYSYRFPMMRQPVGVRSRLLGWVKHVLGVRQPLNKSFKIDWNETAGKRFDEFNSQIKLSRPYDYIPDLYSKPPVYDIYLSGSDQIWNPTQWYSLEPYFLTFVKDRKAVKASYGSSIGLADIRQTEKETFGKWLASYDVISVRERQAQEMLSSYVDKEIEQVPDPTFLLDRQRWIDMAECPDLDEDYILVFSLGQRVELLEKAVVLAREMGCKVKVIDQKFPSTVLDPVIEVVDTAGPREFIGLIKQARIVLTDSFHCTVFSLITNTHNFYTYLSPNDERGSRVIDLLHNYGLDSHIVNSMSEMPSAGELQNMTLDYAAINRIMAVEQLKGRNFLDKVLNIQK